MAAYLPALALSIWWKRSTKWGMLAAMLVGTAVAGAHAALQLSDTGSLFSGLSGLLAAVLGVPAGFATGVAVSLLTPKTSPRIDALADDMRDPSGEALYDKATRLAAIKTRPELPAAEPTPLSKERAPDAAT